MADLILKVTPREVEQKATEINNTKGQMESLMTEMSNMVSQRLLSVWNSTSGEQYSGKYNKVKGEIQDSLNNLMQHVNNLKKAASEYEQLEATQQGKVDQLNDSDIF